MGKKQSKSDRGKDSSTLSHTQLAIAVHPRSAHDGITDFRDGVLHIRLRAAPVDGRANEALIEILSELFDIRKSSLSIVRGEHSREKLIRFENLTGEVLAEKIRSLVNDERG
ncbi:MAG: DUF167 domain-containing protein [Candidatus Xenobiia bacterium LiM19]